MEEVISANTSKYAAAAVGGALCGVLLGAVGGYIYSRHQFQARLDEELDAAREHYDKRLKVALEEQHEADEQSFIDSLAWSKARREGEETSNGNPDKQNLGSDLREAVAAVREAALSDDGQAEFASRPIPVLVGEAGKGRRWVDVIHDTVGTTPESGAEREAPRSGPDESAGSGDEGLDEPDADESEDMDTPEPALRPREKSDKPFLISADEFFENYDRRQQLSLTWYEGDNALVDERDTPVDDFVLVLGAPNVDHRWFGGISQDPSIFYMRNDKIDADLEVTLDRRKFSEFLYGKPPAGTEMALKPKPRPGTAPVVRQAE